MAFSSEPRQGLEHRSTAVRRYEGLARSAKRAQKKPEPNRACFADAGCKTREAELHGSSAAHPPVEIYESGTKKLMSPVESISYNDDGLPFLKRSGYAGSWRTVTDTYDGLGRLISETSGSGHETRTVTKTYDGDKNVLAETDGEGNTKKYTYTVRNKKAAETDALGNTITYQYDRNDNCIQMSDPRETGDGRFTIAYIYDDYNRLTGADIPPVPGSSERGKVTVVYDLRGNALSQTAA
jgi:YD repeat-containing protein